jgi:hypothetical protein
MHIKDIMKRQLLLSVFSILLASTTAFAQSNTSQPGITTITPGSNPYLNPQVNPYANPYANPYYRPGVRPFYGTPQYPVYGAPVYGAPAYGAPVPSTGGYFRFGNFGGYWRAPSGYYYPWMVRPGVAYGAQPIVVVQQGATTASKPPISTMFSDIEKYLDESKEKSKVSVNDYTRLSRRLKDITRKYYSMHAAQGGSMNDSDDDNIRRDLDLLSAEIARSVK